MEAVWRIEVEDFPAFIVVDDKGNDFFTEPAPAPPSPASRSAAPASADRTPDGGARPVRPDAPLRRGRHAELRAPRARWALRTRGRHRLGGARERRGRV